MEIIEKCFIFFTQFPIMSAYYTGLGDEGETSIIGKGRIPKSSLIIAAIGDVDELNSCIGVALHHVKDKTLKDDMKSVQDKLFTLGATLASGNSSLIKTRIVASDTTSIEEGISRMSDKFPKLAKFVLPGGSEQAAFLHLCRSVARRAERSIIAASKAQNSAEIDYTHIISYMNRLSSFFFVAALYANNAEGIKEQNPTYS